MGYQAALVRRQLYAGTDFIIVRDGGLLRFISFSTIYPQMDSTVAAHTRESIVKGVRDWLD